MILEYKKKKMRREEFLETINRLQKFLTVTSPPPGALSHLQLWGGGVILQMSQCSKRPHLLCWLQTARVLFL